jgi:hypothetical protein
MARTRKRKRARSLAAGARLDRLPGGAGYLLTVGPAILWLDPQTAVDVFQQLGTALGQERPPKSLFPGTN